MYQLTKDSYLLLKGIDLTELGENISFDDGSTSVTTENLKLLLILINEEIATKGLSADQNSVTEHGRQLYALYDELLAQRE